MGEYKQWLKKYFKPPITETVYYRKDGKGKLTEKQTIKHYKRAYNLLIKQ